jgi:hypothetical protein
MCGTIYLTLLRHNKKIEVAPPKTPFGLIFSKFQQWSREPNAYLEVDTFIKCT